jgi:DNA-binding transcriptional MocR family regulator
MSKKPRTRDENLLKSPIADHLKDELQREMLRAGGKLPSLDQSQNHEGIGNNSIGRDYPQTHERETSLMANPQKVEKTEKTEETETPPPAGGVNESEVAEKLVKALKGAGNVVIVNETDKRTLTRKTLEIAIPTASVMVVAVAGYAAVTVISNKWGDGARMREFLRIENAKLPALPAA